MSYARAQKSSSWTPPQGAKSSQWAPPPITVQTKPSSASSENQEMPSYKPLPADWATNNPIMRSLLERESSQAQGEVTHSDSSVEGNVQMSAVHGTIQHQCQECQSELSQQEEKPPIQAKLTVGASGDPYEQEADRVAAQVMSMSVAPENSPQVQQVGEEDNSVQKQPLAPSITPVVQRQVNEWVQLREWAQQALQASGTQASGDLESRLNASKGGGSPLAPEVRSFMEPRFGADFSSVRVHTGGEAVQMNRELGAQAFTHGSDVYFGAGKSPGNNELTAHELTHVVQQIGGNLQRTIGNQADLRWLASSTSYSATAATIQRTVTQITPGKDNKIGKLLIVGRPERVFGNSMGDHTTAFATHVEAIKLQMEGKTLWDALSGLKKIYADAKTLPGYALKDKLPSEEVFKFGRARPHGNRLKDAETQLTTLFSNLPQDVENAAKVDQTVFALKLQEAVNAYLEFRELIPLSAVNVMSVAPALAGKGKGESGHTSVLAQYEKGVMVSKQDLQSAILGVFDTHAAAMVVAATDDATLAALAPGLDTSVTALKRVELLATQHLKAIESGFPKSYAAAELTAEELKTMIIAQAKKELLKNCEKLNNLLAIRKDKWREVNKGILAKIYKGKYHRDYRNDLDNQIINLTTQINKINEVLGDSKLHPSKIEGKALSGEEEAKQQETETEEAQKREEEKVEQETRKQPIATQIVLRNNEPFGSNIDKIEIAGRPPSPIPDSMGAHSTAWIVHTDRICKALAGQSIENALKIMNETLVEEAKELEKTLAKAKPPVVEGQNKLAAEALAVLENRQKKKAEDYASASVLAFELQQYINELFTYINYIPGVTREAVNTDGRGEGTYRRILTDFETYVLQNPTIKTKIDPKTKKKKEQKIFGVKITLQEYKKLQTAINKLLDINNLSKKQFYQQAHNDLISKTYPFTWEAIQNFKPDRETSAPQSKRRKVYS